MIYSKEHNKNIKKLFPQYEPLFSTKLIPVLLHLKYWSYDSPYIELPWIPHHLYQVLSYPTETPLQPNNHHLLQWFSYFVLPHSTKRHHKYWLYQTIWQAKPIKFIIKLFTDHHTLWVKHATHQKTESPRAAIPSK